MCVCIRVLHREARRYRQRHPLLVLLPFRLPPRGWVHAPRVRLALVSLDLHWASHRTRAATGGENAKSINPSYASRLGLGIISWLKSHPLPIFREFHPTSWQFFFLWVQLSSSIIFDTSPASFALAKGSARVFDIHNQTIDFTRILRILFGSTGGSPDVLSRKNGRCLRLAAAGPSGGGGGGRLEGAPQPGAGQRRPGRGDLRGFEPSRWMFFFPSWMEKYGKIWMNLNLVKLQVFHLEVSWC